MGLFTVKKYTLIRHFIKAVHLLFLSRDTTTEQEHTLTKNGKTKHVKPKQVVQEE